MPVIAGQAEYDEWERCGCEVAVTVRDMKVVEQKLFAELECRGCTAVDPDARALIGRDESQHSKSGLRRLVSALDA